MSERTRDGLAAARARGRTGGQKPKLGPKQASIARGMSDKGTTTAAASSPSRRSPPSSASPSHDLPLPRHRCSLPERIGLEVVPSPAGAAMRAGVGSVRDRGTRPRSGGRRPSWTGPARCASLRVPVMGRPTLDHFYDCHGSHGLVIPELAGASGAEPSPFYSRGWTLSRMVPLGSALSSCPRSVSRVGRGAPCLGAVQPHSAIRSLETSNGQAESKDL